MSDEQWLPAKGFEGRWEISNQGQMRRVEHLGKGRFATGYILSPKPDHKGYLRTTLYVDGQRYNIAIHLMVLKTFVGTRPEGNVANHKNGDKTDNRLENLEWTTQAQNVHHAINLGLFSFAGAGEQHPNAQLTADKVREIRRLFATEQYTKVALGHMFGVTDANIRAIVNRKTWKHIT